MCEELFYQEALRRFGQIEGKLTLSQPLPLLPLVAEGLRLRAVAGQHAQAPTASPSKGARVEAEAGEVVNLLVGKCEMIDEYFGISLGLTPYDDGGRTLRTLPVLVEQYEPYWGALPGFLVELAIGVDWTEEKPCFDGIARALGKFYAVQPPAAGQQEGGGGGGGGGAHDLQRALERSQQDGGGSSQQPAAAAAAGKLEHRAKHVIFPALRSYLEPPSKLAESGAVLKIASTASLYRVFERC